LSSVQLRLPASSGLRSIWWSARNKTTCFQDSSPPWGGDELRSERWYKRKLRKCIWPFLKAYVIIYIVGKI
jgi:hypothetical protein